MAFKNRKTLLLIEKGFSGGCSIQKMGGDKSLSYYPYNIIKFPLCQ
jgi:hypothetical protein